MSQRLQVDVRLSEVVTAALRGEANRAYGTEPRDLLLIALALALNGLPLADRLRIAFDAAEADSLLDLSLPLATGLAGDRALSFQIRRLKERLRGVLRQGRRRDRAVHPRRDSHLVSRPFSRTC